MIDQASKLYMSAILREPSSIRITGFFSLTLVENTGIGFGLLSGNIVRVPVIIVSLLMASLIFIHIYREPVKSKTLQVSAGLIEGGIAGNLIDRIATGAVIDFLDFHIWPVFNFADTFIVCGIIMFLYLHIKDSKHQAESSMQLPRED